MSDRNLLRCGLLAASILAGASGCGFKLAGTAKLPPTLEKIHLITREFSLTQQADLAQRLRRAGVNLVAADNPAAMHLSVTLRVIPKRRLVSSADSGKTVERIARGLEFSLSDTAGNRVGGKSLRQQRDFTRDEDNLLASSAERTEVVRDIEQTLFNQLIHQLKRF